ncbi:MAG: hypothetical protein NZ851_01030 [Aquificaceae bacterium]|nr:hypothetical protein [Aquificaceae bacterium]
MGERLALGRIEVMDDSVGFVLELDNLRAYAYTRQGFDYFRHVN